jgi:hypothetical protein
MESREAAKGKENHTPVISLSQAGLFCLFAPHAKRFFVSQKEKKRRNENEKESRECHTAGCK